MEVRRPRSALTHLLALALLVVAPQPIGASVEAAERDAQTLLFVPGLPDQVSVGGETLPEAQAAHVAQWQGQGITRITGTPGVGPDSIAISAWCLRLDVAVPPGEYRIDLDILGLDHPTGPLNILAGDSTVAEGIFVEARQRLQVQLRVRSESEPLSIFLKPDLDAVVVVGTVRIVAEGTSDLRVGDLSAPAAAAGTSMGSDPHDVLRAICNHLLVTQLHSGMFAYESKAWWETSYAVRTLLAGYEILGEDRYLRAACVATASFVGEQASDGGWCSFYMDIDPNRYAGDPGVAGSKPVCDTRNLADLGTMATCLSMIAAHVSREESEVYVAAHRMYADRFASGRALISGAYSNGLFQGKMQASPYSIATATQAMSLTALYESTGEVDYLREAERAARFLLLGSSEDGRFFFHPADDLTRPGPLDATQFGDLYYILEGLLWVERATSDTALRDAIHAALRDYLYGSEGLIAQLPVDRWIPPSEQWTTCKANAMLGIITEIRAILGSEPRLDRLIAAGTLALCDRVTQTSYSILDPPCPEKNRMAAICTSFAGLSIARLLHPGISTEIGIKQPRAR